MPNAITGLLPLGLIGGFFLLMAGGILFAIFKFRGQGSAERQMKIQTKSAEKIARIQAGQGQLETTEVQEEQAAEVAGEREGLYEAYILREELTKTQTMEAMEGPMGILSSNTIGTQATQARAALMAYANHMVGLLNQERTQVPQVLNLEKYKERLAKMEEKQTLAEEKLEHAEKAAEGREHRGTGKFKKKVKQMSKPNVKFVNAIIKLENRITKLENTKEKLMKKEYKGEKTEEKFEKRVEKDVIAMEQSIEKQIAELSAVINLTRSPNVTPKEISQAFDKFTLEMDNGQKILEKVEADQLKEEKAREQDIDRLEKMEEAELKIQKMEIGKNKTVAALEKSLGDEADSAREARTIGQETRLAQQEGQKIAKTKVIGKRAKTTKKKTKGKKKIAKTTEKKTKKSRKKKK